MTKSRRIALRHIAVGLGAAFAALAAPLRALAAWPKAAFDAKTPQDAIGALHGGLSFQDSGAVKIVAPELAENGGIVPITVIADVPDVESVTILADGNPRALTSTYTFGKRARGPISVRVKLAKTQNVTALVRAGGKAYRASQKVTVSVGGCGG